MIDKAARQILFQKKNTQDLLNSLKESLASRKTEKPSENSTLDDIAELLNDSLMTHYMILTTLQTMNEVLEDILDASLQKKKGDG